MRDDPDQPVPSGGADDAELARLTEERARLEAEVAELRAQVAATSPRRAVRTRRVTAAALVVLTCVVFTASVVGLWARNSALDTDRWVSTVGPIAGDPAVQAALGAWMTDEIMSAIDTESYVEQVFPERGGLLAGPIENAVRGFVGERIDDVLASDAFARLWVEVNARVHARVVDVLEGDTGNLQVEDGRVVVNLVPVINMVLAEIGDLSPEVLGRDVDLPTLTVDDLPADAVARLEDALGRDLPDDFGQFAVFEADRLQAAQDAVSLTERLVVLAVILALGLVALTLWVSPARRRTLLQLAFGIALGMVLARRLGLRLEGDVVELVRPDNRDAVAVITGAVVDGLFEATTWILLVVGLIALVAVLTGPYPWVRALRGHAVALGRAGATTVGGAVAGRAGDDATVAWMRDHREALQIGGVVVGIAALALLDLSWPGLLLLILVVGGYELAVDRVTRTDTAAPPQEPAAPATGDGP